MNVRRFFSCFLTALFLSALFPSAALASEPKHFHPRVSFDFPIDSELGFSLEGEAYLTNDITATGDIVITKKLTLCLNGHTLNMGPHSLLIQGDGELTIHNCQEAKTGGIIGESGENAVIMVAPTASLTLYGGEYHTSGRSFLTSYGSASIGGGKYYGDDVQLMQCAGNALLAINGGEIHAGGSGSAAVLIPSADDDLSEKRDYNLAIGYCLITADPESPGAVVCNSEKRRLVLGAGTDIRADGCPGVLVKSGIFDAYDRACVYSNSASAIVGTGGMISLYYAVVTSDEQFAVDVQNDAELLLSGSLDLNGGRAGVHLPEGKVFSMSDYGFHGDVRVTVLTDETPGPDERIPISTPCSAKHYKYFLSANPQSSITYDESTMLIYNSYDSTVSHSHDGRNYVLPLNGSYHDLSKNNYYLEQDCHASGFFTGSVVNICLNGHTLKLSSAIKLYPNATLNIFDCQGGGRIECNSTCITGFDGGVARIILHQGDIVSYAGSAILLDGDDSLVIHGGSITSSPQSESAIGVQGTGNSISLKGGSISGGQAAISVTDGPLRPLQDGENPNDICLELSGTAGSISGTDYAISCSGKNSGFLVLNDSPDLRGGTASIFLSEGKKIETGNHFSPNEKISLLPDQADSLPLLGKASAPGHSSFFTCPLEQYEIASVNEELILAKSLPISPDQISVPHGESATFTVNAPGGNANYLWYILKEGDLTPQLLEGCNTGECLLPVSLSSGRYQIFCTVNTESGVFVSDSAALDVQPGVLSDIQVSLSEELFYTGAQLQPHFDVRSSADVRMQYSADGVEYREEPPLIGPETGFYSLFYKAYAEGYLETVGEVTVEIQDKAPDSTSRMSDPEQVPRMIALVVSTLVFIVLAALYIVKKAKHRQSH